MDVRVTSTIETSGKALLWSVAVAGFPVAKVLAIVLMTPRADGRSLGVSPGRLTPLESQRPAAYLYESCLSWSVRPGYQLLR